MQASMIWQQLRAASRHQGRKGWKRSERCSGLHRGEQLEPRAVLSGDGFGAAVTAGDVAFDSLGNEYMVGTFSGTVDFDPGVGVVNLTSSGARDAYVLKLDAAGTLAWVRSFPSTLRSAASSIAVDAAGNLAVGGSFSGAVDFDPALGTASLVAQGSSDGFVARFDAAGGYLWSERFGGLGEDAIRDVAVDAAGSVLAVGETETVWDERGFVAKRDSLGRPVWTVGFAGSGESTATSVAVSVDGAAIVGGEYEWSVDLGGALLTSAGQEDGFIARYAADGTVDWARSVGGLGEDSVAGVATGLDGSIVVVGEVESITPPPSMPTSWYGHDDWDDDSEQGFVMKLDAAGGDLWSLSLPSSREAAATSVAVDALGGITVGGSFSGTISFDPAGAATFTADGYENGFVARYDATGSFVWATPFGGGNAEVDAVAVDAFGQVLVGSTGGIWAGAFLTELDANGLVVRSDAFVAVGGSRWHRDPDDGHDEDHDDGPWDDQDDDLDDRDDHWDDDRDDWDDDHGRHDDDDDDDDRDDDDDHEYRGPDRDRDDDRDDRWWGGIPVTPPVTTPVASLPGGTTVPKKTFWDESSELTELLPARIKEDDGTPFILHDDVEHRDKVRRSLESREILDADDLLELRRLSQAQLALLKVWLASAPSVAAAPAAASLPATTFAAYGGTSPASKSSGQTTKTTFFANPGIS
ncbi:MAG: hypothetical protein EBS83_06255 [Planctomycetia bacterium]|nr:hypothetical protein [Planctomycetia bacterium]